MCCTGNISRAGRALPETVLGRVGGQPGGAGGAGAGAVSAQGSRGGEARYANTDDRAAGCGQGDAGCSDLGRVVDGHLGRGELVPDEIMLCIVRQTLNATRAASSGYVIDGLPRTMAQARAAYKIATELDMSANVAVHLRAEDKELTRRLLARAALEHRSDDTEQVIRHRLDLYQQVTQPIIAWFAQRGILVSVDAMRPVGEVGREILAALELMRPPAGHIPARVRRPVDLTGLGARCAQT